MPHLVKINRTIIGDGSADLCGGVAGAPSVYLAVGRVAGMRPVEAITVIWPEMEVCPEG